MTIRRHSHNLFLPVLLLLGCIYVPGAFPFAPGPIPPPEEEALFLVSSRRPLDRTVLTAPGRVLYFGPGSALVRTTQAWAESLAGEGMEIKRVMPRTGLRRAVRRSPSAVRVRPRRSGDPADDRAG
ncbi:MAG: hypothetical protein V1789_07250 [PVC group bacterium]